MLIVNTRVKIELDKFGFQMIKMCPDTELSKIESYQPRDKWDLNTKLK
jgi:hypothetical protein